MTDFELPPLRPDIRFQRLPDTEEALVFSFAAKKAALGPHIIARWPWDESYQRGVHRLRFERKPFFSILREAKAIGTLSWMNDAGFARFGEFYLLPQFQGQGLGTRILCHVLEHADARQLPVRLEFLKWNPVGRLYLRHGFRPTHESETHVFAERLPGRQISN